MQFSTTKNVPLNCCRILMKMCVKCRRLSWFKLAPWLYTEGCWWTWILDWTSCLPSFYIMLLFLFWIMQYRFQSNSFGLTFMYLEVIYWSFQLIDCNFASTFVKGEVPRFSYCFLMVFAAWTWFVAKLLLLIISNQLSVCLSCLWDVLISLSARSIHTKQIK